MKSEEATQLQLSRAQTGVGQPHLLAEHRCG